MAFWDFVKKLIGGGKESPPQTTAPADSRAAKPSSSPEPATVSPPTAPSPASVAPSPQVASSVASAAAKTSPPTPSPGAPSPGDFLPIKREDLLAKGEDVRRTTGWMWFGRRDMIPPISDPRTLLIDRGMLTQGQFTAEELAEMHRVGDEWSRYANRLDHIHAKAGQSAEAAVEADRATRAEVKARKKAEAAARRQKRKDAISHRKATDIAFVGKGVSALLGDRASDLEKLRATGLPQLQTPAELAAALGIPVSRLRWLCFHSEASTRIHYIQFEVAKKSGGTRILSAPHRSLAAAQEWVLANVLTKLTVEDSAHGFVPGRSTLTNALPHSRRDLVINLDLESFFPSIGFARVRHLFRRVGYSGAVATLLALLCTECPRRRVVYDGTPFFVATGPRGLPQGACTSPAISNQIARRLDRRLGGLARKLELTYTRYADDLTFSAGSGFREKLGYLLARIRHIVQDEGFAVNPKKTRVRRPESRQVVTGLVVNADPAIPRATVRRLRAILHHAKTEGLAAQNRDNHPNFTKWVEGMIAYVAMVKPALGQSLWAAYESLPRG